MLNKEFKLNIVGNILSDSGYSSHIKQLASALNKTIDVAIETPKMPGWELQCSQELVDMANKNYQGEATLMIGLPPFWELCLSGGCSKFIGFLVFEATPLPISWISIINDERVSQVWTCSEFCKKIMVESGVIENKIWVIPHGYNPNIWYPKEVKQ